MTAIAGDPQRNLDFYAGTLGLRLVKVTVNYDDPGTYHLYYGDGSGSPGSIMTFFPWPGALKGRIGTGQLGVTSFAIPAESAPFWAARLVDSGVAYLTEPDRFGETVIAFEDPDGLKLELIAASPDPRAPWTEGPVPVEHAIRGFHSVSLWEESAVPTERVLVETMGLQWTGSEGDRSRYTTGGGAPGTLVDIVTMPGGPRARVAVGTVHHVAWRTPGDEDQQRARSLLIERGFHVSPVMDRQYFHSIYYRETGGVLFEIATDPPGFTVDEPKEELGTWLRLPAWLEPQRERIQQRLPRIKRLSGDSLPCFIDQRAQETLLLLHGTGGNEEDLLGLGRELAPEANYLSPRGKVLEHGMPRFFRRLSEGMFDIEDLKARTLELALFIKEAAAHYGFDPGAVTAAGYSNGANIAASLLLMRPGILNGAVLFRPMLPLTPEVPPDLSGVRVLIGAGRTDRMIPADGPVKLADALQNAGADVTMYWHPGGHELARTDVEQAKAWLSAPVRG